MQTTNQPQTTNNSNDRDASVQIEEQIKAFRISKDMAPAIRALKPYQQKAIYEFLAENRHLDIYRSVDLMGAWLAINGIYGFERGIMDIAEAIYNPMPPDESDPSRPVFDLELSTRTINALMQNGIKTLGQLAAADHRTLFVIPFIGKLALRQINDVLVANGYATKA